jgi:hypothetical protein
MSDEIICSECGRPNLPEAEKCWYCQALLKETTQGEPGDDEVKTTEEIGVQEHSAGGLEPEKIVEDIPEWLKRVRELKKADQPEEEEEDQWRQQILFESQVKEKSVVKTSGVTKPRTASKPSEDKPESPSKKEETALFTQESENSEPESSLLETENTGSETSDEGEAELPDGFTPLDTNKG